MRSITILDIEKCNKIFVNKPKYDDEVTLLDIAEALGLTNEGAKLLSNSLTNTEMDEYETIAIFSAGIFKFLEKELPEATVWYDEGDSYHEGEGYEDELEIHTHDDVMH